MFKFKNFNVLLVSLLTIAFGFSFAQSDVSDEDLETFVAVYQEVQAENQKLQQGMTEIIQKEGMDIQRFNEIYEASASPEKEVEATDEELETHAKVVEEIEQAQTDFQAKVVKLIEKEGMTLDRYQEVFAQLQTDQELQQKFSELMQKG